jgi:hypothetical protein
MYLNWTAVRIFVRPGATDLKKQINGLAAIAQGQMSQDPFSGSLYLFCNRTHKNPKALYWNRNGFCLWQLCEASHNCPGRASLRTHDSSYWGTIMKTTDFANYLSNFLGTYIPGVRNVSTNTIRSYR